MTLEVIAVAASAPDEETIERLLEKAGVRYEIGFDAAEGGDEHRVCYLGRSYAVERESAQRVREILREAGLDRAIAHAPRT